MIVQFKNDPRNHRLLATESEALSFVTQTINFKKGGGSKTPIKEIICFNFQQQGHYASDCKNPKVDRWEKTEENSENVGYNKVTTLQPHI